MNKIVVAVQNYNYYENKQNYCNKILLSYCNFNILQYGGIAILQKGEGVGEGCP